MLRQNERTCGTCQAWWQSEDDVLTAESDSETGSCRMETPRGEINPGDRDQYLVHFQGAWPDTDKNSGCMKHAPTDRLSDKTIFESSMSRRARFSLIDNGIDTFGQLVEKSANELFKYRNLGRTTLYEIRLFLGNRGEHLSGESAYTENR